MNLKYFELSDFECACCGVNDMHFALLVRLDRARELAGIPFVVSSGYRCEKHNRNEGGSSTSSHLKGLAVDIRASSSGQRFKMTRALMDVGFTRIGVSKAGNFIHVDGDLTKPKNVMWLY